MARLLDRCWTYWATRVALFCPWTRATTLLITFRIQVPAWCPEGIWSATPNCLHLAHTCLLNLISVKWTREETMTTGAGTHQQVGNNPVTLVRCSSYWTKQAVLFSPCTPATILNSQYKNVHWIKTVFYSIHFLAVRWSLIWIYTVSSGLSCVYSILQYPFIRCVRVHTCHISHCEIKSHRIWPIWKAITIKNSNLTEFQTILQQILWRNKHKSHTVVVFTSFSHEKRRLKNILWEHQSDV